MSLDKLVDSTQLDSDLTSVANAIRTKGGTSAQLAFPAGFVSAIGDIPTGGGTPSNISVKIENSSNSSGAVAIQTVLYNSTVKAITAGGQNSTSISTGGSTTKNMLNQDGTICFNCNVALSAVTYNGVACAYQQSGSGSARPTRIVLPDNYDNTVAIVIKR